MAENQLFRLPDNFKTLLFMDQLYFGRAGESTTNKVFPSVDCLVLDWSDNSFSRVISVDSEGIPELELVGTIASGSGALGTDSLLTSLGIYNSSSAVPIFFDSSTIPYRYVIDRMAIVKDANAIKASIFKGTDTSAGGVLIASDVTLTDVDSVGVQKTVDAFTGSTLLEDGDVVTVVIYDSSDTAISRSLFSTILASAIRPATLTTRVLTSISLISELIDDVNVDQINNVLGSPFETNLVEARLFYDDGTSEDVTIDGEKVKLLGLENFADNLLVKPTKLDLAYFPDPNEPYQNGENTSRGYLLHSYTLANIKQANSYALKLYPIPMWDSVNSEYTLEWRLVNLERSLNLDVTSMVTVVRTDSSAFNGSLYGTQQDLEVSINMDEVDADTYNGYIFPESISITLGDPLGSIFSPWVIDWGTDSTNTFGGDLFAACGPSDPAVVGGNTNILLSQGIASFDDWLDKMYNTTEPLYDTEEQSGPTEPTHFRFEVDGAVSEIYEISRWSEQLPKPAAITQWTANLTVNITWLFNGGAGYEVLGYSPIITRLNLTDDGIAS